MHCEVLANQVLELCRLDEICVHHAMHFIDVLQHRASFLDVVVRQCLPVFELLHLRRSISAGLDECFFPCLGS